MDLATALSELVPLASGKTDIAPSSGLGTNAGADASARKVPKAVIVGGTVPAGEAEEFKAALAAAAPGVKIVSITREDIVAAGGSGPDAELITKLIKEKLVALSL